MLGTLLPMSWMSLGTVLLGLLSALVVVCPVDCFSRALSSASGSACSCVPVS